ncbi:MAG: CPBP family intramembrane glutamic endopeptidase [Chitinophagales bacterium]
MNEPTPLNNIKHPLKPLLHFLLIWFLCFLSFNVLGAILVGFLLGVDPGSLNFESLAIDENIWALKVMQIFVSAGSFLLPPLVYIWFKKKSVKKYFGFQKGIQFKLLLGTVVIVFLSGPVVYWLLQVNQQMNFPDFMGGLEQYLQSMEQDNENILIRLLSMETIGQLLLNLFMVALLPGIGEELLFRGVLQKLLGRLYKNPHLGIIGAALIFSFIHFQFYGFLPRMALGVLFGYLYYWSGNLWYPIIAHVVHNGAQVIMVYSMGADFTEQDLESIGQFSPFMIMIATVFLIISLARFQFMSKH